MKLAITTVFFFIGAAIGYFMHPEVKPEPEPKGYIMSYQANITNNMTKIANLIVVGPRFTEIGMNQVLGQIYSNTNIINGSAVILNAIPVY